MRKSSHPHNTPSPPFLARLLLHSTPFLRALFGFFADKLRLKRIRVDAVTISGMIGICWLINPAFGWAQIQHGCTPAGAKPASTITLKHDGVLHIDGDIRLSLAGVLWPDALEEEARDQLYQSLTNALAGQIISWKPAGTANRWGIMPAYLFVQEKGTTLPPFWLQAGMVEAGLTPAWPNLLEKPCWQALLAHERSAQHKNLGYWASTAQTKRHATINADLAAHQGRHLVARWRVSSVKAGRAVQFINLAEATRNGSALWLSQNQATNFAKIGKNSADWQGKWIILRFVLNEHGFRRIRVETTEHVDILDEKQANSPQPAP